MNKTINKILKYARKKKNLKQKEVAKKCNITVSTLSGYETGYSQPKFDMIEKILEACDFEICIIDKADNEKINSKNIDRLEI